jgi:hypothetical protein
MEMNETIWLMDSDFCQNCATELADVDGYCWWCWEKLEDEWNRDDDEYVGDWDDDPEFLMHYFEAEHGVSA